MSISQILHNKLMAYMDRNIYLGGTDAERISYDVTGLKDGQVWEVLNGTTFVVDEMWVLKNGTWYKY